MGHPWERHSLWVKEVWWGGPGVGALPLGLEQHPSPLPQLIIRFIFLLPPLDPSPWQQFSQLHFISFSANLFFFPVHLSFSPLSVCLSPYPWCSPFLLNFSVSLLHSLCPCLLLFKALFLHLPPSSLLSEVQDRSNKLESIGWTRA